MRTLLIIFILLIAACSDPVRTETAAQNNRQNIIVPADTLHSTDTLLVIHNGLWLYRQRPYSGYIETHYENGQLKMRQSVFKGKEEGWSESFYEDGNKEDLRYYHSGEKDSIHTGWWVNGNKKFEYHFTMSNYDGQFREWYNSGRLMKDISYDKGKETSGKGWRENGKPYMSFVVRDGRLYGLVNPNLCYSLKNEKGEYLNSLK